MADERLRIKIEADAKKAERDMETLAKLGDELTDDELTIVVAAKTQAAQAEVKRLTRLLETADDPVDIKVLTTGISQAEAQLRDLAEVGEQAEESFGGMADAAGMIPGPLGEAAGLLGGGGGIAAGAAAVATSLIAAGTSFADAALDAKALQVATGGTVEQTSRLLAATQKVGLDYNDLQEIVSESNRAMSANADEAERLGVNLKGTPLERFEQLADAVYKIPDPLARAAAASKFFGEEGSKQMGKLIASAGTLKEALDQVADASIISEEDVKSAQEFSNAWAEFKGQLTATGREVGRTVLPALTAVGERSADAAKDVSWLSQQWDKVAGWSDPGYKISELLGWRDAAEETGKTVEELAAAQALLGSTIGVGVSGALHTVTAAAGDAVGLYDELRTATEDAAEANEELLESHEAIRESMFGLVDAQLAAERSWTDLNAAVAEFGTEGHDSAQDARNLTNQVIGYANAQVTAAGTTRDTTEGSKKFKEALQAAASVLGEKMTPEVEAYIAQALLVPDEAITDIHGDLDPTEFDEAERRADALEQRQVEVKITADVSRFVQAAQNAVSNILGAGSGRTTQSTAARYVWRNGRYVEVS